MFSRYSVSQYQEQSNADAPQVSRFAITSFSTILQLLYFWSMEQHCTTIRFQVVVQVLQIGLPDCLLWQPKVAHWQLHIIVWVREQNVVWF